VRFVNNKKFKGWQVSTFFCRHN